MVSSYVEWFFTFVREMIAWMGAAVIVPNVSLLAFIAAVSILCIFIGGLLIR